MQEKWYAGNSLNINKVQQEFEKLIHDYLREGKWKEEDNKKLLQSIATLTGILTSVDEWERSRLNKNIARAEWKIGKNNHLISTYSQRVASLQDEVSNFFTSLTKYRLDQIPSKEQFSLWLYQSLRAREIYISPDYISETPLTEEWVKENVLDIFIKILWTYLEHCHGVNIRNLSELLNKINELPEEYRDDILLPDTEGISQKKVNDFFEMLYSIIPKDYLSEISNLPIMIALEPEERNKEKIRKQKPRKSHSEIRKENHEKKMEKEETRTKLKEELRSKEEELMEYIQYWREKLIHAIRIQRAYSADIESI